jgi:hypothetical protein
MNSLYNKLMAEKGAPRAAPAPNQMQMRGAPMNLRSAMQKYAVGGEIGSPPPSAGDINNFVQANIGNPQAIMQAAAQYGVSMDDLANATGYSSNQINDYFGNAGLGSLGTSSAASAAPYVDPNLTDEQLQGGPTFTYPEPGDPNYEPPMQTGVPEQSLSPYLPTYTPPAVPEQSLSPYLPTYTPPSTSVSPEMLRKIQESMGNPFGSQITSQDELMKLLQSLKAR